MTLANRVDSAIMRLRREVNKSGHLRILKARYFVLSGATLTSFLQTKRFFENPREKKKRKIAEARRKMKFARQMKRRSQQQAP